MSTQAETRQYPWMIRSVWAVLIIGGLLVLVLIPALSDAREKARRANCLSRIHGLGFGVAMYADNYQGRSPVDKPTTLLGSFLLMSSTAGSPKILVCPSDSRTGAKPALNFGTLTALNISYSYIPNLLWDDGRTNMILWLDRIYTTERGGKWPRDGNHGSAGGNVAFTDGHIGFFKELPENLRDKDGRPVVLSP